MAEIFPLTAPVQDYAWGSRTALAELQGRPAPAPHPEAELWIGAHPSAPAQAEVDGARRPLDALLAESPERLLDGSGRAALVEGHLPFLLKILAIDAPLSLQVHPSPEQARAGWEREEREGVPAGASHRCYKDRFPKPETVVALTRVEILTGVRPRAELQMLAEALDLDWLRGVLEGSEPVIHAVLGLPEQEAAAAVAELEHRADELPAADATGALVRGIASCHPQDRGLLLALCMNHVVLEPGEAMHTPAGQLHAYLRGTAVEIMAPSDNVLRAGLTPKHVDVPELLATVREDQAPGDPLDAPQDPSGVRRYPLWDDAVTLVGVRPHPGQQAELAPSTAIVLCTEGVLTVEAGSARIELTGGRSAWVRSDGEPVRCGGPGAGFAVGLRA